VVVAALVVNGGLVMVAVGLVVTVVKGDVEMVAVVAVVGEVTAVSLQPNS